MPELKPTLEQPLRRWPGLAAGVVLLLAALVVVVVPDGLLYGLLGSLAAAVAIVVWWLFFSRALWFDRLATIALMAVAVFATKPFLHPSIAGLGRGRFFYVLSVPAMAGALVAAVVAGRRLSTGGRRAAIAAAILTACGAFAIVRTSGIGEPGGGYHWRWTPTPEERLLAQEPVAIPPPSLSAATPKPPASVPASGAAAPPAPTTPAQSAETAARAAASSSPAPAIAAAPARASRPDWPGFRGAARDGVVRGVRLETDWSASPPRQLWRRPIGPGWSSFAVDGDRLYTQEQRGEHEMVACYKLNTGEPVWRHSDPARFWEANAGAGPRGTPTLHEGRVYALGATGILNALEAATGALYWSKNAATDSDVEIPEWGFAGSPLVVDDLVIVAMAGRLVAYDRDTGDRRWLGPSGGAGYSSPHLATLDGVPQVLLLRGSRSTSVALKDGAPLWEHVWQPGASIVQPAVIGEREVLVNSADAMGGQGLRRITVFRGPNGWTTEERWTSRGLKPYFNDFVVHAGHAYGFDGNILACIDLTDGARKWKGGRYGAGQMLLIADQDLLLVTSDAGELALVKATPDRFTEVARFTAIAGKTWNHPVLVGDVVLVRNAEEMAAFRLPLAAASN
jgi:outer membrane protein assembly factor BamB